VHLHVLGDWFSTPLADLSFLFLQPSASFMTVLFFLLVEQSLNRL